MKRVEEKISIKIALEEWDNIIQLLMTKKKLHSLHCFFKEDFIVIIKMQPVPYSKTWSIKMERSEDHIHLISVELLTRFPYVSREEGISLQDELTIFFSALAYHPDF